MHRIMIKHYWSQLFFREYGPVRVLAASLITGGLPYFFTLLILLIVSPSNPDVI
jgi:hypothetical protein